MINRLLNSDNWRQARAHYMEAARQCRNALTDPAGAWKYDRRDPAVKMALSFWIERARQAHDMVLGRKPVIPRLVVMSDRGAVAGAAYVGGLLVEGAHV